MINEGLSEINGAFPVPPPGDKRGWNDDQDQREEATGTWAVCKPRLPSIIVIGSRSIIVTTLMPESATFRELIQSPMPPSGPIQCPQVHSWISRECPGVLDQGMGAGDGTSSR